ncbi:LuxR family transcriptional regulator [Sphingomonas sp. ABOLD]|uniref:LuxR family quorum-sensing system transcriptional regulator CciR n=1 Tax=Sphingomonas trueperi TaxID=53317 RepID=A0A7X6BDS5_9SPHN|nr:MULTISPECIES: LuxR family transcriptional regulator [Sphingomonas]NJB98595.1 LuxR family quorum-sensing system transcriptional regulator CciR [Sphingomonas trueperi]RSV40887.1 LuxR family transcriptional regulator [Sphingomonas sp. ABOLE]RSV44541.1 LuxR family transcriptional regulator [Sphingomonas sp. ABOLD]
MPERAHPAALIEAFDDVSTRQALSDALGGFCAWSGLPWYALGPLRPAWRFGPESLTNFPAEWRRRYDRAALGRQDPVIAAVTRRVGPVDWREIAESAALTSAEADTLALAAAHGLRGGVSMAVHLPGKRELLVSFAGSQQRRTEPSVTAAAWMVAAQACNCWRRLEPAPPPIATRPLTRRQRECLVLVAQGKSDWDIGQILGLSDQTVHAYIGAIRSRYGSAKRVQLVVRALFEGQLSFDDVLS